MGLFSTFMKGVGQVVGEQVYPIYENALRLDVRALGIKVASEDEQIVHRTAYLLALMRKDRKKAYELYKHDRRGFDNALKNIFNYRRFEPIVNEFRMIIDRLDTSNGGYLY